MEEKGEVGHPQKTIKVLSYSALSFIPHIYSS